jgi:hypothetical protein
MGDDMEREKALLSFNLKQSNYPDVEEKTFVGESYYVLPVTMMVAGAYYPDIASHTSKTALFFGAHEIKKSLLSWAGKPASRNHPDRGMSLAYPDVFDKHWVGFVFGATYNEEQEQLKAELWLNKSRSSDIVDKVKSGDSVEVSIGAYGDIVKSSGEANGVEYSYEVLNLAADHLAILPEDRGACSWEDGCGIRAIDVDCCNLNKNELHNESGSVNTKSNNAKKPAQTKAKKMSEENKKVEAVENVAVEAKEAKCAEKVLKSKVTLEDVLKEESKYCPEVLAALKDSVAMRDNMIAKVASYEFDGERLDRNLLGSMSTKELGLLGRLINYKEKVASENAGINAVEDVDFSLGANVASKKEDVYMMPREIDWS